MVVLKRRNRTVNFRLSEDEYDGLKQLCLAEGVRSISDFARDAVCRTVAHRSQPQAESLDAWVRELDGQVKKLHLAVKRLHVAVATLSRSSSREGVDEELHC